MNNSETTGPKIVYITTEYPLHQVYYRIAKEAAGKVATLAEDAERRLEEHGELVEFEMRDLALQTVVFSALAAEALINHYAITKVSRAFLDKYVDRLNPVGKWVVIPKHVTGKQLDTGGQAIEKLTKLVELRNQLVHYKTAKKKPRIGFAPIFPDEGDTASAIEAIELLAKELRTVDPDFDPKMLDNPTD